MIPGLQMDELLLEVISDVNYLLYHLALKILLVEVERSVQHWVVNSETLDFVVEETGIFQQKHVILFCFI